MTYQDKVAVIDNGLASLENGASWEDFQARRQSHERPGSQIRRHHRHPAR